MTYLEQNFPKKLIEHYAKNAIENNRTYEEFLEIVSKSIVAPISKDLQLLEHVSKELKELCEKYNIQSFFEK